MFRRLPEAAGETIAFTIDGIGNRQACLIPAREGMRVGTQTGARAIAEEA